MAAIRARLAVPAMDGEIVPQGRHVTRTGESTFEFLLESIHPAAENLLNRRLQAADLLVGQLLRILNR